MMVGFSAIGHWYSVLLHLAVLIFVSHSSLVLPVFLKVLNGSFGLPGLFNLDSCSLVKGGLKTFGTESSCA